MAIIYVCGFDHYGPLAAGAWTLEGGLRMRAHFGEDQYVGDGWASQPRGRSNNGGFVLQNGFYSVGVPSWGARRGDYALMSDVSGFTTLSGPSHAWPSDGALRLAIPGSSQSERWFHIAFSLSALPSVDRHEGYIASFHDSVGDVRAALHVTPTGRLQLVDGSPRVIGSGAASPNILLTSNAPVIQAETWYSVNIYIDANIDDTADVQVWLGEISPSTLVLNGNGLAFTGSGNIDMLGVLPYATSDGSTVVTAARDIVVCDGSGSYNTGPLGQVFVSAQDMREETPGSGWEANHRQNIGTGILDSETNNTGLRAADAAALEFGSGDFTVETWARFHTLPGSSAACDIVAKWSESNNNRSYRLAYFGSDGTLRWLVSTDGINVTTVKSIPWVPVTDRWYHLAVVRASGQTMLFVNGVQFGVPLADANTYFNGTAPLGIAARYNGTTTLVSGSGFDGWLDETRITVGVARYTSDFTPQTTKFGRNGTADPDFSNVVLLLGYDSLSVADESSYGRTMSTTNPAVAAIEPDDGTFSYQVLNNRPYLDDTYIEAAQLFAENIFTFEDVPTPGETMTIGTQTYTWASSLSTAGTDEVVIGADVDECIDNILNAINGGAGAGTIYSSGLAANAAAGANTFLSPQFIVRALAIGTGGNAIATTDTMADGYFSSPTLTGGKDIPADSDFSLERLPNDVTGVLGIQMTTRHYKTDAGSATVRVDFIGPADGVATGDAQLPDLSPAWARQIFEEDPDTSASLTPSSLIGGRIRFKRTT